MRRVLWFRRDLRVDDNALLSCGGELLPIFIFDEEILKGLSHDDKRVSFLFQSVLKLKADLKARGLDLALFYGRPADVFRYILKHTTVEGVCASGDYDAYARARDAEVSRILEFEFIYDTYIFRPDEIVKEDGSVYLVFTPFYNKAKKIFNASHMRQSSLNDTSSLIAFDYGHILRTQDETPLHVSPESIGFTSTAHGVEEVGILLERFKAAIAHYGEKRDFISQEATSGLGIHLRFGTLGIRTLLHWLKKRKKEGVDTEPFFRQLLFREFYACLLYHLPYLQTRNFRYGFNGIKNSGLFKAFCEAKTGVPIVDAGIKELLATGKMHNRVRMICASFFTKDLLLPWQKGERFFAQHLLDYDASSNILSWQWSSGTGVDPQPYFRVFNPYLQAKKFDRDALYIKRWLPQLREIDAKHLHDEEYLLHVKIENYPSPIVVHKEAAKKAVQYFKNSGEKENILVK